MPLGDGAGGHAAVGGRGRVRVGDRDGFGELEQRRTLARTEGSTSHPLPRLERARPSRTRRRDPQPSLVARAERGPEQRPRELDEARRRERAQPTEQAGATLRRREVADRSRPPRQLVEEVQLHGRQPGLRRGQPRLAGRRHLGHELEALEHARREHRADHRRERREIVVADPLGEREAEGRQQRAVGADARRDRAQGRLRAVAGVGAAAGPAGSRSRSPAGRPSERDEHGLAGLERRRGSRARGSV